MNRTVLLVDDQPEFLELARALLNGQSGVTIVGEATNGAQALGLTASLEPEVVILDVQMPGMNGIETTRRLLAVSPRLDIVLVSAHDDVQYESLARAVGARAFLAKQQLSAAAILDLVQNGGNGRTAHIQSAGTEDSRLSSTPPGRIAPPGSSGPGS